MPRAAEQGRAWPAGLTKRSANHGGVFLDCLSIARRDRPVLANENAHNGIHILVALRR